MKDFVIKITKYLRREESATEDSARCGGFFDWKKFCGY